MRKFIILITLISYICIPSIAFSKEPLNPKYPLGPQKCYDNCYSCRKELEDRKEKIAEVKESKILYGAVAFALGLLAGTIVMLQNQSAREK